jgi:cytoskeleton protein RodZ
MSLSERLKRERELRGISLKQISEETRIGVRFLEALEENKIEVIPGEFYRRSYLRAYARYLGLDEDRALNAYDYSVKEKKATDDEQSSEARTPFPMWLKWVVVSIFIVVPAVLLLRAMPGPSERASAPAPPASSGVVPGNQVLASTRPGAETPQSSNPFPSGSGTPPTPASGSDAPVASAAAARVSDDGSLRLALTVEESCWLEIEADGVVVVSGLKDVGFRDEVSARHELRLWLGNAGGVKLSVNDRPVRPLGRPGQVRKDLTITTENYREYTQSRGGER